MQEEASRLLRTGAAATLHGPEDNLSLSAGSFCLELRGGLDLSPVLTSRWKEDENSPGAKRGSCPRWQKSLPTNQFSKDCFRLLPSILLLGGQSTSNQRNRDGGRLPELWVTTR